MKDEKEGGRMNDENGRMKDEGGRMKDERQSFPIHPSSFILHPSNVVLIGMKSSGKTTVGRIVARKLGMRFTDLDAEVERRYLEQTGEKLPFREIFKRHGGAYFRALETAALQALLKEEGGRRKEERHEESSVLHPSSFILHPSVVLATGGGLPLAEENRPLLKGMGTIVFLDVAQEVLLPRIVSGGIPAFFPYPEDPARSLAELLAVRRPIYGGAGTPHRGVPLGIPGNHCGHDYRKDEG